jgi:hypothetical protein
MEYLRDISEIYDEREYEYNEELVCKKVIFLLISIAREDGLGEWKEAKELLNQYK